MKHVVAIFLLLPVLCLAACGGDPDVVDSKSVSTSVDETSGDEDTKPAEEQGVILRSGFGQSDDQYVGLAAVVKNKSDHAGQTVTVSFNIKDKSGKLLKTESQVDSFAWPGQEVAVVTQADIGQGNKAASVEATLLVEDDGIFADSTSDNLGDADAELADGEYGNSVARVRLTNPTDELLKSPGVKVVCENSAGKIRGSGYMFPELIAAGGQYAEDVDVIVSSDAERCTSYLVPGLA